MNVGLVVGGIIVMILGMMFIVDGFAIMGASTSDSFLGVTYTDEETYDIGFTEMLMGVVIGIVGLVLLIVGLVIGGDKTPQPVPMVQPYAQPPQQVGQYPPQQVPYQQPQYQPPPVQAPPPMQQPPVMAPVQQSPIQQAPVQPVFCGACGFKNSTVAKFCNSCGESLDTKKEVPSEPEPVEEIPVEPVEEVEFIFCEDCGHRNMTDAKFCNACGGAMKNTSS